MSNYVIIDENVLNNLLKYQQKDEIKSSTHYLSNDNFELNDNIIIIILVILIICIIIYLYYICKSNNTNKNSFTPSAKSQKDLEIINNLYKKDSNIKYSEIKSHISDFDPVKYNQINSAIKNNSLTAEFLDKI